MDKKPVVITYGRFQSPTIGHAKLINKVNEIAKNIGGEGRIYPSKTHDSSKNPIPYPNKVQHLRKLFPEANIVDDPDAISPHHVIHKLAQQGHRHITMVVGQDRVPEMQRSIGKYIKKSDEPDFDPKKHYDLEHFKVVSAGDRDPDADGEEGASGTKMRSFAKNGDFKSFAKNTPTNNIKVAKDIFKDVKNHLKEDTNPVTLDHKSFGPMLDSFVSYASDQLGILAPPKVSLKKLSNDSAQPSFGGYNPSEQSITVLTKHRHPMDIYRTVAHELVHHKQNEAGQLKDIAKDGATGSDIENEANSEAGKIMRNYGRQNPETFGLGYVTEETLNEGIHDPGIFKAVFLAGGSGSGKDYVMHQVLDGHGLKEINSDRALEFLMKKNGLSLTMPHEELQPRTMVRGRAKMVSQENQRLALSGRQGLIINGTADDPQKIKQVKDQLENLGYKTMMVFVDTSNEVSRARNISRGLKGGRTVPEDVREAKWKAAQESKIEFEHIFGKDNFVNLDNSHDSSNTPDDVKEKFMNTFKKVRSFVQSPLTKQADDHIQSQMATQRITQYRTPKLNRLIGRQGSDESRQAKALGLSYFGFGRYGKVINGVHTVTHISNNGRLMLKPHTITEEKTMNKDNNKPKKEMSFVDAQLAAREAGSLSFNHGGKIHSTKQLGEFTDGWLEKMEHNRNKNPKTPIAKPKISVKAPKAGTKNGPPSVGTVIKDAAGNPMNKLIQAHMHKKTINIDKAFQAFTEENGKSEWGAKKLKTEASYKLDVTDAEDDDDDDPEKAAAVGLGPEFTLKGTPIITGGNGFTTAMYEDQLPKDKSIKEWALKEETLNRFVKKYGDRGPQKLVETAKKLAKY